MSSVLTQENVRVATLGATGIFASISLFISAVDAPVRETLPPAQARESFQRFFPPTAKLQSGLSAVAAVTCATMAYTTGNRALYAAAGAMAAMGPYTLLFLQPEFKPLMSTAMLPDAQIRQHLQKWRRLHLVRTITACLAFGMVGYAS
ncbi:hypothetical protein RI367_007360 [Sorochytrium milnesiophthora]